MENLNDVALRSRTLLRATVLSFLLTGLLISCTFAQVDYEESVSRDLLDLFNEYVTFVESGRSIADFVPTDTSIRVDSGFVLVDAVAVESGHDLFVELVATGLQGGSAYGLLASGWYPIESLARTAALKHLKEMRPARMGTGIGPGLSELTDSR